MSEQKNEAKTKHPLMKKEYEINYDFEVLHKLFDFSYSPQEMATAITHLSCNFGAAMACLSANGVDFIIQDEAGYSLQKLGMLAEALSEITELKKEQPK